MVMISGKLVFIMNNKVMAMKLWQWGLILIAGAGLVNGLLVSNNIGGVIRELMRLEFLLVLVFCFMV